MSYINFDLESCKDCYSCLRNCPVKAIKFTNDKAEIIENMCILCGHCVNVCPQNAKKVVSDLDNVKELIKKYPNKVILSVAPSFLTNFNVNNFTSFKEGMLKLGFYKVEETARGAKYVTNEYKKILDSGKQKLIITTACPSVVTYIRQYYPNCIKYLAKVISPMVAHGKILKQEYGDDYHVVFVGPCIAKKKEALESKIVDYALTFEELDKWIKEKQIKFEDICEEETENANARFYPVHRGIIKSFGNNFNQKFDAISIDGSTDVKEMLNSIEDLDYAFIEMNMCKGGCVNGPMRLSTRPQLSDSVTIRRYAKNSKEKIEDKSLNIDLSCKFSKIENNIITPSEEQISSILKKIFKNKKEDEINCRACGYNTCRDKAIAVFNGLADPEFCMPYLKNKAESISNEIITHTPNGIITVNNDGILMDINERAMEYLDLTKDAIGHYYKDYIELPEFKTALENGENISSIVIYNDNKNMYFDVSITFVKEHKLAFAIYKDVTEVTLNDEKMKELRNEMIEVTDKVINKQMAAVQEIASLLGESTAEAKIALINFKKSLKDNEK